MSLQGFELFASSNPISPANAVMKTRRNHNGKEHREESKIEPSSETKIRAERTDYFQHRASKRLGWTRACALGQRKVQFGQGRL